MGRFTFVYGGSSHVIETQGRVHVVDVLQEREKVLHLFKCDALHAQNSTNERAESGKSIGPLAQPDRSGSARSCEDSTAHRHDNSVNSL